MKRRIWIATDTASDDVMAIIIALKHPDIEVVGMSVVAGNVPLEMGVQNARITVERCTRALYAKYSGGSGGISRFSG